MPASRKKSVWRNKNPKKEDRFFRGRQIAHVIYDFFRVTGAIDSVENFAELFTVVSQNDNIQEFDTKWDEILLSITQIPSDGVLESLYKLRIRESEKLKTVLEVYNTEIHQKKPNLKIRSSWSWIKTYHSHEESLLPAQSFFRTHKYGETRKRT